MYKMDCFILQNYTAHYDIDQVCLSKVGLRFIPLVPIKCMSFTSKKKLRRSRDVTMLT